VAYVIRTVNLPWQWNASNVPKLRQTALKILTRLERKRRRSSGRVSFSFVLFFYLSLSLPQARSLPSGTPIKRAVPVHKNITATLPIDFIFCWPCISLQILGNNQLDALFHVFIYLFIYFMSLHVSRVTALIIRRSNCINTSSGMISLCKWLLGMPVTRELQYNSISWWWALWRSKHVEWWNK